MPLFLKERKNLTVLIALISFHLLLISMQVPQGQETNFLETAVFSVFSPLQHGIIGFFRSIGKVWRNYCYLRNVQNQNSRMREEIFYLRQENNILRNVLRGFRSEKEIQDTLLKVHENILPAQVIGLDTSNFYKSVVINRGSLDGLRKDMVVLDRDGHLIGRVIELISLKEARVQLITDEESGIGVFSARKRIPGILAGDGEGQCFLKYVLATTKIEDIPEGEEIISSGYDRIYPSGLKLGKIVSVKQEETSLHWRIVVEPYLDFRYLDQVAVIMKDPKEFFKD